MTISEFHISALTLFVGSFDPYNLVSDMTYSLFGKTLNLAQLLNFTIRLTCRLKQDKSVMKQSACKTKKNLRNMHN